MKPFLKKLICIFAIVAVFAFGALVDWLISLSYDIEFVSVTRLTEEGEEVPLDVNGNEIPEDSGIADGKTTVRFVIRLTQNGKNVEGHTLYIKTNRNILGRVTTDENGLVTIDYRCYRGRPGNVTPIVLTVKDEDNSVFVVVAKKESYTLPMAEIDTKVEGSGMTTNDIFYDI